VSPMAMAVAGFMASFHGIVAEKAKEKKLRWHKTNRTTAEKGISAVTRVVEIIGRHFPCVGNTPLLRIFLKILVNIVQKCLCLPPGHLIGKGFIGKPLCRCFNDLLQGFYKKLPVLDLARVEFGIQEVDG
jgi:hypothetical protein